MRSAERSAATIVEAAYRWTATEKEWLDGIVEATKGVDLGGGVVAYTVELATQPAIASLSSRDVDDAVVNALAALTTTFSRGLAQAMYAPTEFAGNAAHRLERVAPAHETTREAVEEQAATTLPPLWAVIGGDPRSRALLLGFLNDGPIAPDDPFPKRKIARHLGLVGAHLGAALRLLGDARGTMPTADDAATEAVLDPSGKVLHATDAVSPAERTSLAAAVERSEKAKLLRTPDEEALDLWRALVDGKWTIIDMEERGGKRLLLARRNAIGGRELVGLNGIERDSVWLAALGHSLKYIAYELGLTEPIVARRLATALKKLGFASRRDLIRFFAGRTRSA